MKKLAIAISLLSMAGCSTVTPNYDARFGDALRQAKHDMTINPDAGKHGDQVAGIDGKSANEAIGRYERSFREPPPVINAVNIGGRIGTTSGAGR